MSITPGQPIAASDFVGTSSGASDSGKVPKLNGSGLIPAGFLPPAGTLIASGAVGSYTEQPNERTIISVSIPGGTLNTGNGIRFQGWFTTSGPPGDPQLVRVKYGSTTLATITFSDATASFMFVDFTLVAAGSTSSQQGAATVHRSAGSNIFGAAGGSASEDSTGALNLILTYDTGSANTTVAGGRYLIEKIGG